jgi:hypothetical protein
MATGCATRRCRTIFAVAVCGIFIGGAAPAHAATGWILRPASRPAGTPPLYVSTGGGLTSGLFVTLRVPTADTERLTTWTLGPYDAARHGYRIFSRAFNVPYCFTLESPTDSQTVFLEGCPHPGADEFWQFYIGWPPKLVSPYSPYLATNMAGIRNTGTGKCLSISPAEQAAAFIRLRQYPCSPDDKRRWRVQHFVLP